MTAKDKSVSHKLNRFTTIPVLIDMLENKRLVLSDPKKWPDKNDSELITIYEKYKKHCSNKEVKVFVMCFLMGHETVHHWNAFANGISGCCIEFDQERLKALLSAEKNRGVRFHKVAYKKIASDINIHPSMIPFQKRDPYKVEREFRVVGEGFVPVESFEIKLPDLDIITKITLSPNLPDYLFESTRVFFQKQFGRQIHPSSLYENSKWIAKFETLIKSKI